MQNKEECLAKAAEYDQLAKECQGSTMEKVFQDMAQLWRGLAQALNAEPRPSKPATPDKK
jgi:hypothetical protein